MTSHLSAAAKTAHPLVPRAISERLHLIGSVIRSFYLLEIVLRFSFLQATTERRMRRLKNNKIAAVAHGVPDLSRMTAQEQDLLCCKLLERIKGLCETQKEKPQS